MWRRTRQSGKEKTVYKRETVLCTFKKDKAVAKAIEMSGQSLAGRPVKVGLNTEPLAEAKQASPHTTFGWESLCMTHLELLAIQHETCGQPCH